MAHVIDEQEHALDGGDILYPSSVPFVLLHVAALGAIWSGISVEALWLCLVLYVIRIFAIGAGYHRYFSHRAFATSRVFQFILAFLAQSTAQKSVVWWAAKHRHHHLHSDTEHDVHSPRRSGFWYAHLGWIFARRHDSADLTRIGDLTRYPELMWLHRYYLVPPVLMGAAAFLSAGWSGLIVGFIWSTVLLYHATFCINSLAHVHGSKRYVTGDDSRNNWFLAVVTFGEGWHNNHHAYQSSARQGFRWWEVDATFYVLTVLSWTGLVWGLKRPPESVVRNQQRLGSKVIERAAAELAATFQVERIAAMLRERLDTDQRLKYFQLLLPAHENGADIPAPPGLPRLPTLDEIGRRASTMFAKTPSLDEIVDRAYRIIREAVGAQLVCSPG